MTTPELKAAIITEMRRLSGEKTVGVSRWDQQRSPDLPCSRSVKNLFDTRSWPDICIMAGLKPNSNHKGGHYNAEQDARHAQVVEEMGKNAAPPGWSAQPLCLVASEQARPHSYYCTTRRCKVETVRRVGRFDYSS